MATQIYVNLPVKDLNRTKEFFSKLGFTFNPQFTDDNAASMVVSESIYVMLITEKFFQGFIGAKKISNALDASEVINCITRGNKQEVDDIVDKALAAGATTVSPPQDHGWMYVRGFQDLDGHLWEFCFIDASKAPANPSA